MGKFIDPIVVIPKVASNEEEIKVNLDEDDVFEIAKRRRLRVGEMKELEISKEEVKEKTNVNG